MKRLSFAFVLTLLFLSGCTKSCNRSAQPLPADGINEKVENLAPEENTQCAGVDYDAASQACCNENAIYDKAQQGCCSNVLYKLSEQGCCNGVLYSEKDSGCCNGNSLYSRSVYGCCSNVQYRIAEQGCCSNTLYDLKAQKCIDNILQELK